MKSLKQVVPTSGLRGGKEGRLLGPFGGHILWLPQAWFLVSVTQTRKQSS